MRVDAKMSRLNIACGKSVSAFLSSIYFFLSRACYCCCLLSLFHRFFFVLVAAQSERGAVTSVKIDVQTNDIHVYQRKLVYFCKYPKKAHFITPAPLCVIPR